MLWFRIELVHNDMTSPVFVAYLLRGAQHKPKNCGPKPLTVNLGWPRIEKSTNKAEYSKLGMARNYPTIRVGTTLNLNPKPKALILQEDHSLRGTWGESRGQGWVLSQFRGLGFRGLAFRV